RRPAPHRVDGIDHVAALILDDLEIAPNGPGVFVPRQEERRGIVKERFLQPRERRLGSDLVGRRSHYVEEAVRLRIFIAKEIQPTGKPAGRAPEHVRPAYSWSADGGDQHRVELALSNSSIKILDGNDL